MVNKEKELTVEITALSDKGVGIAYLDDMEIYVPNALIGERVRILLKNPFARNSRRYDSVLLEIISSSKDRVNPTCPHFSDCGACQLMHMNKEAQAAYKAGLIDNALQKIGISCRQEAFVYNDTLNPSRFKSIRNFALKEGSIVSGFYKNYTNDVITITSCLVEDPRFSEIAAEFDKFFNDHKDYFIQNGNLILKHFIFRSQGNGIMLLLTVKSALSKTAERILQNLAAKLPVTSFYVSINQEEGNRILGSSNYLIYGEEALTVKFLDLSFKVRPNSFLQVNYVIAERLYQRAVEFCYGAEGSLALDLCCGVGTMTLALGRYFEKVIGVEIVKEAVECARENASLNHMDNVEFIAADINDVIDEIVCKKPCAVIADPSRVGLGVKSIKALSRLKGDLRLALIFCSLKALSRDVYELLKYGFKLEAVQGFDMFEHSTHVETLVLLSRAGNVKSYISSDMSTS